MAHRISEQQAEARRNERAIEVLLAAMDEIAKAEGAFSRDPLTHAENTIHNMTNLAKYEAAIAREILDGTYDPSCATCGEPTDAPCDICDECRAEQDKEGDRQMRARKAGVWSEDCG